jgi:hypothetical protein
MTYNIIQSVGPFAPGQSISSEDFPNGTDYDRLLRLGAIALKAGEQPPDPPKITALKRQLAVAQSTIASLQAELNLANGKIAEYQSVADSDAG